MRPSLGGIGKFFNDFFETVEDGLQDVEMARALQFIEDFNAYADSFARANPHVLHHVYEWNMAGDESARLFKLNAIPMDGIVTITWEFLPSVTENNNQKYSHVANHVFRDKASVMESGNTVEFSTEKMVPTWYATVWRSGTFTFNPGGPATDGAFGEVFENYFAASKARSRIDNIRFTATHLAKNAGVATGRKFIDSLIRK
jgi:hypothetical protein